MHFLVHFLVDFSVNKEGEEGHINHPQQKKKDSFLKLETHPSTPN
jgi:hypothetical protein